MGIDVGVCSFGDQGVSSLEVPDVFHAEFGAERRRHPIQQRA
jgi:hypothetical protein